MTDKTEVSLREEKSLFPLSQKLRMQLITENAGEGVSESKFVQFLLYNVKGRS